jgi:glycosyltransferase involved in cell wall biosynthesis
VLAGPDEGGHQAELESRIYSHGLSAEFSFPGMVDAGDKWNLYRKAAIVALVSESENFGMSAAEALSAEVAVIASKGTPWSVLEKENCGWWTATTPEVLAKILREATALNDTRLIEMGKKGRRYAESAYESRRVALSMIAAYRWLLAGGQPPPTVHHGKTTGLL